MARHYACGGWRPSWSAVFGGLFIALITYFAMSALGLGLGGLGLESTIESGENPMLRITWGTAIWVIISTIVALFVGGFFSARFSYAITKRAGAAHALVMAGLFFTIMALQSVFIIGAVGSGLGAMVQAVGKPVGNLLSNPAVVSSIEGAFDNIPTKQPIDQVVKNLAGYLARNDIEGARRYLARETGVSTEEAERRISQVTAKFQQALQEAGAAAARGVSVAGWMMLALVVLGGAAAIGGGVWGGSTVGPQEYSLSESEFEATTETGAGRRDVGPTETGLNV